MPTKKSVEKHHKIGRPIKARIIRKEPKTKQFSPRGKVGRPSYKTLKFEEIEAIRLADYMDLDQSESAKHMGISQQTFSRVLRKARKTLAEALINGEIIKVQGGDFLVEIMRDGGRELRSDKWPAQVNKRPGSQTKPGVNPTDISTENQHKDVVI